MAAKSVLTCLLRRVHARRAAERYLSALMASCEAHAERHATIRLMACALNGSLSRAEVHTLLALQLLTGCNVADTEQPTAEERPGGAHDDPEAADEPATPALRWVYFPKRPDMRGQLWLSLERARQVVRRLFMGGTEQEAAWGDGDSDVLQDSGKVCGHGAHVRTHATPRPHLTGSQRHWPVWQPSGWAAILCRSPAPPVTCRSWYVRACTCPCARM